MKTLKELDLLDKFLFDETMDMPQAQEAALQLRKRCGQRPGCDQSGWMYSRWIRIRLCITQRCKVKRSRI